MENNQQSSNIRKELLSFEGKIHLICNDDELLAVADQLKAAKILGFDTETKPSFKKGQIFKVALLQLSTKTDAYLIRLHYITQFQPLLDVLGNPNIIKAGVAIRDDIKTLQKAFTFEAKNFIELQDLAKAKGHKKLGLRSLAEELLKGTLTKGPKMTNWEAPTLTEKQLVYAATDAWMGLMLFEKLGATDKPD